MSDRVTKAPKKIELPIIKGKASEVLRGSPLPSSVTSSTRQVAGASEFKKIPSILDNILVYAKKPIDRTVDISINTQAEETYESLDNTNGFIGLSTKHVEDHNKLLKDMLEVIKDDDSNSGGSNGGGSILDGLFGDRKPKPKKPKKDTTSKKRTAPPPAPDSLYPKLLEAYLLIIGVMVSSTIWGNMAIWAHKKQKAEAKAADAAAVPEDGVVEAVAEVVSAE